MHIFWRDNSMFSKFCDICQAGRGNVHVTFSVLTLDKNEGERAEGKTLMTVTGKLKTVAS